jgi:hypothetical protein
MIDAFVQVFVAHPWSVFAGFCMGVPAGVALTFAVVAAIVRQIVNWQGEKARKVEGK